jgi:hypothetical protein
MNMKLLVVGDVAAIGLLTVIGFTVHGEMSAAYLPRMGASFFPVALSWFLLAPWFGLFDDEVVKNKKFLWRAALAMFLSAPLAAIVRAALLQEPAQPLFAFILGGSNAIGIMVWRWIAGRRK